LNAVEKGIGPYYRSCAELSGHPLQDTLVLDALQFQNFNLTLKLESIPVDGLVYMFTEITFCKKYFL